MAYVWAAMCDKHLHEGLFEYTGSDEYVLTFLELRGFIISTEIDNTLIVKVLGQKTDEKMTFYCPGNCDE